MGDASDIKPAAQHRWGVGINLKGPQPDDETAAKVQDTLTKLAPQIVDKINNAHNLDVAQDGGVVKRQNPPFPADA